ncbi:MAG: hypothetical protein AABZ08_04095 [Planctomycetota bacterium]
MSALVLATVITLTGAWLSANQMLTLQNSDASGDPYRAAEGDARFATLRPYLKDVRVAGWMASRAIGASEADEVAHSQARYAIVPTLLTSHGDHDTIVTCFDTDAELDAAMARDHLELIGKTSPGVAVVRRPAK